MMKREQTIKDFIGIYDGWLDESLCKNALEVWNAQAKIQKTWKRNHYQNIGSDKIKDSTAVLDGLNVETWEDNLNPLLINLQMAWEHYVKETDFLSLNGVDQVTFTNIKLQQTKPGEGFHIWHVERNFAPQFANRVAVFTVYLNEDFEGGETEFLLQHQRVSPKTGRICFFPSAFPYIHRGNPPINGDKYILTSWLIEPSRSNPC